MPGLPPPGSVARRAWLVTAGLKATVAPRAQEYTMTCLPRLNRLQRYITLSFLLLALVVDGDITITQKARSCFASRGTCA